MYRYSFFCSQGIRENNQDACYVDKKENGQLFAIVCDGVGSEKHSEVASQTTITTFADAFLSTTDIKFLPFVQTNAKKSYDDIVKTMDELYPNKPSSTTMICCLVENKRANIAWIGDSRIFHFNKKENKWSLLTRDQNLLNYLIAKYERIATKIKNNPNHTEEDIEMTKINFEKEKEKNKDNLLALTDALENSEGSYEAIEYNEIEVDEGDYILLCSDGVYNWISLEEVSHIIETSNEDDVAENIVKKALENKSNDNSTAILLKI